MTSHAYLPTFSIRDEGNVFVCRGIHEVAEILSVNLGHATSKHAQEIGILERAHAIMNTTLEMESRECRKQWHVYLPIAVLKQNTTYHSRIDCEPSRVFLDKLPHNILYHNTRLRSNPNVLSATDFADELFRTTKLSYDKTKKRPAVLHQRKRYYDKRAKVSTLKVKEYCFILQTKAEHQGSKICFRDFRWIEPYLVY